MHQAVNKNLPLWGSAGGDGGILNHSHKKTTSAYTEVVRLTKIKPLTGA